MLSGFCWLMDVAWMHVVLSPHVVWSEGHPSVARPTHVTPIGTLPSVEATREGPRPRRRRRRRQASRHHVMMPWKLEPGKWFVVGIPGMHQVASELSCDVRENRGRDGGRGARHDGTRTAPTRRNRSAVGERRPSLRNAWQQLGGGNGRAIRVLVARGRCSPDGAGPVAWHRRAKDVHDHLLYATKAPQEKIVPVEKGAGCHGSSRRRRRRRHTAEAPCSTVGGAVIVPKGCHQLFVRLYRLHQGGQVTIMEVHRLLQ
jgi:hypothetical protein